MGVEEKEGKISVGGKGGGWNKVQVGIGFKRKEEEEKENGIGKLLFYSLITPPP